MSDRSAHYDPIDPSNGGWEREVRSHTMDAVRACEFFDLPALAAAEELERLASVLRDEGYEGLLGSEYDVGPTDVPQLTFHECHVDPILAGRKTATIRYDLPDDEFRIGDRFQFVTPTGRRFATGYIADRGYTDAATIAALDIDGHRSYEDVDELLEELSEYYPDADLTPETSLDILYWNEQEVLE